jgi:hypothetical protein
MPSKADREILEHNHRVRMQPLLDQQAELKKQTDAKIAEALAGLKAAVEADKKLGLDETARLRDVQPVRPKILDQSPEWDWEPAKVAKFNEAQNKARAEYFEHLVIASPTLLSPSQFGELPQAIRFCNEQQAAAQAAAEGKIK